MEYIEIFLKYSTDRIYRDFLNLTKFQKKNNSLKIKKKIIPLIRR